MDQKKKCTYSTVSYTVVKHEENGTYGTAIKYATEQVCYLLRIIFLEENNSTSLNYFPVGK